MFDLCGPFQIDGNFGAPAGIAEMLLQSQWMERRKAEGGKAETEVRILDLLPALPKEWPTGSVTGLCARGGFVVDLDWKDGALTRAVIHSKLGNPCLVRCGEHEIKLQTDEGGQYVFDSKLHR